MGFEVEYLVWFLAASSLVLLVFLLIGSRRPSDPTATANDGRSYPREPERSVASPQTKSRVEELVFQRLQSE